MGKDGVIPLSELISLSGKCALITGAAAGIGEAIAYRFAEAGADLELVDVNEKGLINVKEKLSKFNTEIDVYTVDLSNREEIDELWEKLSGREPDILVNNAGIYPFKNFFDITPEFYGKVMEINLNSVFWMCQHMIKKRINKGGTIINVGSIEAILPFGKDLTHYTISKAGVIALTRALAREYGKHGFKVNVIIPGGIMTPGTKKVAREIFKLKLSIVKSGLAFKSRLPLGRFGQPDEVARVALFLASELSSYVQGALITVDGGFLSA
ncbi:MAG: SDR family NAD(P)-dependent oxidoreductase [Candidatus Odinarchaeia archaeon]